jgi:hypothetical protein
MIGQIVGVGTAEKAHACTNRKGGVLGFGVTL